MCVCVVYVFVDQSDLTLVAPSLSLLTAKFPDYKSTWSPDPIGHNPTHLSNKMWKNHISSRNTTPLPRPPPGLTNPKPSSPWSSTAPRSVRGWGTQDSRLASGEQALPPQAGALCSHKCGGHGDVFTRGSRGCLAEDEVSLVENRRRAKGRARSRELQRERPGETCLAEAAAERLGSGSGSGSGRRGLAAQ